MVLIRGPDGRDKDAKIRAVVTVVSMAFRPHREGGCSLLSNAPSGLTGRRGVGSANGTLGELVQGQTVAGEDFLVTFPVEMWSEVTVVLDASGNVDAPKTKPKSKLMVELALDRLGLHDMGAVLDVDCRVPEGRGLASSTADVVATARAVSDATGLHLEPGEIAELAIQIEPSDGVMWDGVVAFNHRAGRLLRHLGQLPDMRVLGIDLGGTVDTVTFNKRPKDYTQEERYHCQAALDAVADAIANADVRGIGEACTISARIHQRVLPKPELPTLLEISAESGGAGVNVAHSGTVVGIIFEPTNERGMNYARDLVAKRLPHALPLDVLPLRSPAARHVRFHARH